MGFTRQRRPSQAFAPGIERYKAAMRQGMVNLLLYYAARIEADMKTNAPWDDQTSNARQTLAAFVHEGTNQIVLVAKQQMTYGVYLELANGGRYAIVMPTLQAYYGDVWDSVQELVR